MLKSSNFFKIAALSAGLFVAVNTVSARGRGVVFYSNGEKLETVQELPETAMIDEKTHVNLGVYYNQFAIFWVPMWNYGTTKYVLVNDDEDTYSDITAEELASLKEEYKLDIPDEPNIGFWNKIGGKIIWCALIALIIYGWLPGKKKKASEVPAE